MEEKQKNFAKMCPVKAWEDVKPFAGEMVAFETTSNFLASSYSYNIDDNPEHYGLVGYDYFLWHDSNFSKTQPHELGFMIHRLLKKNGYSSQCILVNTKLESAALTMRFATSDEIEKVYEALACLKAMFEGMPSDPNYSKFK